jgi:hypothetical protein
MHLHRIRSLPAIAAIVVSSFAIALPVNAAASRSHRHHHAPARHSTGIPQHNGGDRDADNNGGPSDGDGNI